MQKAIGWEGITFPGIGLPVDSANQWDEPTTEETAFLKASEYDEIIDDPTAFLVNKWLPRFTRHIVPLGSPVTFEHNLSLITGVMAYNKFTNDAARYAARLEGFADEFAAIVSRQVD